MSSTLAQNTQMKALVTGGGGFLGGRIVELLLERGATVRVFGRKTYPLLLRKGVECAVGDLRDPAAVEAACDGCDTVFHVAALAGVWGSRRDYFEINDTGTDHVIRACVAKGVGSLVYTSSPSVVFGDAPISGGDELLPYPARYLAAYPESKAAGEKRVLAANGLPLAPGASLAAAGTCKINYLRTCALRPHLIWGPGDPHLVPRLVEAARSGRLRQVGDGRNRVDITYIDHAAIAHILAAEALRRPVTRVPGNAYFIADREPVQLWPWLESVLNRLGLTVRRPAIPYATARRAGAVLETVHRALPFLGEPRMTRFVAAQLAMDHWFSHKRAERDFGYRPAVPPELGMNRLVDWLRHSGKE